MKHSQKQNRPQRPWVKFDAIDDDGGDNDNDGDDDDDGDDDNVSISAITCMYWGETMVVESSNGLSNHHSPHFHILLFLKANYTYCVLKFLFPFLLKVHSCC